MRRLISLSLLALTACTPAQIELWQQWHREDPAAAEAFVDDGCAGMCEGPWIDVTTDDDIFDLPAADDGIYWPWDELAECESNSTWDINTGNGYYGGLQFALGSWQSVGGQGYPHEHSPAEQIHRAELLQDQQGWSAWPTCARIIGLL